MGKIEFAHSDGKIFFLSLLVFAYKQTKEQILL